MRDLTVCLAYYSNALMLEYQLANFARMEQGLRDRLRLIVVDDGSPVPAFISSPETRGFRISLYRMGVNIPWNQDACRNLAMSECKTEWALLTDMDHLVPEETLRACMAKPLRPDHVYRFARVSAPAMGEYKPHPNSWLLTRAMYDDIGGYDERFAGLYGTDGLFAMGVAAAARAIALLPEYLIRCPREYIPDASTTTLERKSPEDMRRIKALRAEIARLPEGERRPMRGRFPWERVL